MNSKYYILDLYSYTRGKDWVLSDWKLHTIYLPNLDYPSIMEVQWNLSIKDTRRTIKSIRSYRQVYSVHYIKRFLAMPIFKPGPYFVRYDRFHSFTASIWLPTYNI